jgi:hypothetical protein
MLKTAFPKSISVSHPAREKFKLLLAMLPVFARNAPASQREPA